MKTKKLNFIRGLRDRLHLGFPLGTRLMVLALAVLLFATPALAAGQGEVPQEVLPNKPEITIQGNLVVDNGKPTGFYELALCVKSPRCIEGPSPDDYTTTAVLSESDYARALKLIQEIEAGDRPASDFPVSKDDYDIKYYPFTAASAVVGVNADILTAVGWNVTDVTYAAWDSTANEYKANNTDYPLGIDVAANTPADWDDLDADPFPKVDEAKATGLRPTVIALDAAGDSANTFTVAAQVVDYHEDTDNNVNTAFITMSANAHGNKPVVFKESTPVVVIRFSYDLKRFSKTSVNKDYNEARDLITGALLHATDQITGDSTGEDQTGFWIGFDRGTGQSLNDGKTPLTWLADSKLDGGSNFKKFEEKIAQTEVDQSVWTRLSTKATAGGIASGDWDETSYYYYLGAEGNTTKSPAEGSTIQVDIGGTPTTVKHVAIPDTNCPRKVLTPGTAKNPAADTTVDPDWNTEAGYTYFENLLHLSDETLRIKLVNEPTYKKPTGGKGGNQILFYDWDDTLIGALIVDKGDVRADVNRYIEENLVHPDLRAGEFLTTNLGGTMPDFTNATPTADETKYANMISSLDREYTYRGQYPKTPQPKGTVDGTEVTDGEDYPLTNKLDYVFYKHLNTVTSAEWEDTASGKKWTENYYTLNDLTADPIAAQYPWVYGWAIVEDATNTKVPNKANWPVMVDSAKIESTWTTFGVGELKDMDPDAAGKALPTPAAPQTMVLGAPTYPGGLDADWSTDSTKDPTDASVGYTFMTSSADANGYLRFADFSDTSALFKNGQDVLIVKAVYEPGEKLDLGGNYTIVDGSLRIERYSYAASTAASVYSFQYQYQRAWEGAEETIVGVGRTREPAVQTSLTYDINGFEEQTGQPLTTSAFYLKTISNNSDIMDVDLLAGGVLQSVGYRLIEGYGANVSTGTFRSAGGEWGPDIKDNFNYTDYNYSDRLGTDGFVVEATINTICAEATKAAWGESNTLATHISVATLNDLNIKKDTNEGTFNVLNYSTCTTYIKDLFTNIVASGLTQDSDGNDIYDPKTGYIMLGWHQIQREILNRASGMGSILSASGLQSDSKCAGFAWCRLDDCAGDVAMSINGLGDLMKAIHYVKTLDPSDKNYQKADDALNKLTGPQLNVYKFRMTMDGVPYDTTLSDADLATKILGDLKTAYDKLALANGGSLTEADVGALLWSNIQGGVIQANGGTLPASPVYWWDPDNYAPPKVSTWDDLLKYTYDTLVGVDKGDGSGDLNVGAKVPDALDGLKTLTKAQLDTLIKEDGPTGTPANFGWLRKGIDEDGLAVEFTNAEEFYDAWIEALPVLIANGYDTPTKLKTATWEELQYAILTAALPGTGTAVYKSYSDILAETSGADNGPFKSKALYWNDGGQPKLKVEDLIEAVSLYVYRGKEEKLDALLSKGIGPVNNELYLRKEDPMGRFESLDEFKLIATDALVKLLVTCPGSSFLGDDGFTLTMEWEEFQWLLLNYKTMTTQPDKATIEADPSIDYWWKDGGSPTTALDVTNVNDLVMYALWIKENVFADALDKLTVQNMTDLGLRADGRGIPYDPAFDVITAVKNAVVNFPYTSETVSAKDPDDLRKELQYALLNGGSYQPAASIPDYWWQGTDGLPITNQQELLEAAWLYYVGDGAGNTVPEAFDNLDNDFVCRRVDGLAMRRNEKGGNFFSEQGVIDALGVAMDALRGIGKDYDFLKNITQYELQYLLIEGGYEDEVTVKNYLAGKGIDYWWFTQDEDPNGSGETRTEIQVSEEALHAFFDGIGGYLVWNYDYLLNLTTDTLNDTLLLRMDEAGTKFADTSLFFDWSQTEYSARIARLYLDGSKASEYTTDGTTWIKYPSWEELQYVIIHLDDIENGTLPLPTYDVAREETEEKYDWKFKGGGGGEPTPPTPTTKRVPKEIDEAAFKQFLEDVAYYISWNDTTAFDNGVYDENTLASFYLRNTNYAGGTTDYTSIYDFMEYTWVDEASWVYNALLGAGYYDGDGATLLKVPKWYEVQYIILNYGAYTDHDSILAEAEKEDTGYTWGFETVEDGSPTPPPAIGDPVWTAKTVDEAAFKKFLEDVAYYISWNDTTAFDNGGYDENSLASFYLKNTNYAGGATDYTNIFDFMDYTWVDEASWVYYALSGAGYYDGDGATILTVPKWYEVQYILLNYGAYVDEATAKAAAEDPTNGYTWGFEYTGGSHESPIDMAKWHTFIRAASDYAVWNDDTAFWDGTVDLQMVGDLLLRNADGSALTQSDIYEGTFMEPIVGAIQAIRADSSRKWDFYDPNDGMTLKNDISWYEFQYAFIHQDEIKASGKFPSQKDCVIEGLANYSWRCS